MKRYGHEKQLKTIVIVAPQWGRLAILDEASSALDLTSERAMYQLLQEAPPEDGATQHAILRDVHGDQAPRPFGLVFQAEAERFDTLVQGLRAMGLE